MNSNNNTTESNSPVKLRFRLLDIFKVFGEMVFAYGRTFIITPGLYYTGKEYDISAPLLVTSNYHLTVWSVWRRIKHLKTRILIIDTDGINVWCSAGKGKFNAFEIMKQLDRYPHELLSLDRDIQIILPKLSLSGVKMSDLRKNNISPVIGPIYAGDLPEFLQNLPYKDCNAEQFTFDLADRLFTLLSTLRQIAGYSIIGALILFILNIWLKTGLWWQVIPLSLLISTVYVIFFPLLPTKSFVYKGIFLFLALGIYYEIVNIYQLQSLWESLFYLSFMAGFSMFFGLYYTGNSGVSNYSIVKRETILFLPVVVLLLFVATAAAILKGVLA